MTLALASTLGGFTLAAVVSTACTAMDPGEVDTDMGPFPSLSATATSTSTGPSAEAGGGGDASRSGPDGSTTPTDGGTGPAACSTAVTAIPALFAAAPPWSSGGLPTQTAASLAGTKHNFTLGSNPFGQDCSTCHKTNGANGAGGFIWFVGGSITDCNGAGLGGAQVVMVAADGGVLVNVYTDTDGNLWSGAPTGVTAIPDGAQVLVRLQNGVNQVMPQVLAANTSAGCSNSDCHGKVGQGLPHVP